MKTSAALLVALASALALSTAARATPMTIEVALSSDLEVPPVTSDASGTALFQFDPEVPEAGIGFELQLATITTPLLQAHIHQGGPGVNGDIVAVIFEFCDLAANGCDGDPGEVEITGNDLNLAGAATAFGGNSFADIIAAMQAGDAYINIHTEGFPSGELRGNIPEPTTALLFASGLIGLETCARRWKRRA
jgi:hypothetical protein